MTNAIKAALQFFVGDLLRFISTVEHLDILDIRSDLVQFFIATD